MVLSRFSQRNNLKAPADAAVSNAHRTQADEISSLCEMAHQHVLRNHVVENYYFNVSLPFFDFGECLGNALRSARLPVRGNIQPERLNRRRLDWLACRIEENRRLEHHHAAAKML